MRRFTSVFVSVLVVAIVLLIRTVERGNAQSQAPQAPRTLTVLVSGGQDTTVFDTFFPHTLRIRAGDTVTWKFNGDPHHRHTVTLVGGSFPGPKDPFAGGAPGEVLPGRWAPVPGGAPGELMRNPLLAGPSRRPGAPIETYDGTTYANSGELSSTPRKGTPLNESFSLTFAKPGIYHYACAVHRPQMVGVVEVLPATATDVPDQAQIDAQAKAEMNYLLALIDKAKDQRKAVRSLPGPNDTTFWFVRAGGYELPSGEMRGLGFDYYPKNLTINTGDTVIWDSVDGHTITFIPAPPAPETFVAKAQGDAYPLLIRNPKVFNPAKPAAFYDPIQYFNSGPLAQTSPVGTNWALTFDKPGVYEYFCAFHHEMGMQGTITVVER